MEYHDISILSGISQFNLIVDFLGNVPQEIYQDIKEKDSIFEEIKFKKLNWEIYLENNKNHFYFEFPLPLLVDEPEETEDYKEHQYFFNPKDIRKSKKNLGILLDEFVDEDEPVVIKLKQIMEDYYYKIKIICSNIEIDFTTNHGY
eukprot:TRINITY_DN5363_c0_g1_i1.p1 TRINITY_DN5363_c0_g1~~TRINITY_DN5363_c0_g1_i1.p1  ORF type:complete len:155 (-),score=36.13 TRINITY_DN5363_c0_g1_i1:170-607(-)